MKILFLDVDGVLNTRPGSLDPEKLELLADIVGATGCKIVLSSSWRTVPHMRARLAYVLECRGMKIHSDTPELTEQVLAWGFARASPRWMEIIDWFKTCEQNVESYCILDDLIQADDGNGRFVQTWPTIGLREKEAAKVIEILSIPL